MADDDRELYRLRDRVHRLEGQFALHGWRLDALESWRRGVDEQVKELADTDMIEKAVHKQVQHDRTLRLSWTQRVLAIGVALASIVSLLHGAGVWG